MYGKHQTSVQLGKSDGSKGSNLETSAWQRRSIARSNSGVECKSRRSNAICLVTLNAVSHVIPSVLSNFVYIWRFLSPKINVFSALFSENDSSLSLKVGIILPAVKTHCWRQQSCFWVCIKFGLWRQNEERQQWLQWFSGNQMVLGVFRVTGIFWVAEVIFVQILQRPKTP